MLIVGGHTVNDQEPKYGMAVTGFVEPGRHATNAGAKPGDRLVLTKPLGTGIITTAGKNGVADPDTVSRAIQVMLTLNKAASEAMMEVGIDACTDISGFGLLGHLQSMVEASGAGARIHLSQVPLIEGTRELVEAGVAPGGTHRNLESIDRVTSWDASITQEDKLLLSDAQTSGGLPDCRRFRQGVTASGSSIRQGSRGGQCGGRDHREGRGGTTRSSLIRTAAWAAKPEEYASGGKATEEDVASKVAEYRKAAAAS